LNDTGPAIQQAPPADSSDNDEGKEDRLMWTEEMLEQLVEVLYQVFDEGGALRSARLRMVPSKNHLA